MRSIKKTIQSFSDTHNHTISIQYAHSRPLLKSLIYRTRRRHTCHRQNFFLVYYPTSDNRTSLVTWSIHISNFKNRTYATQQWDPVQSRLLIRLKPERIHSSTEWPSCLHHWSNALFLNLSIQLPPAAQKLFLLPNTCYTRYTLLGRKLQSI